MSENPTYIQPEDVETVAKIATALVAELWVCRDRIATLERVLTESGVLVDGVVDRYQYDPAAEQELQRMRIDFVRRIYKDSVDRPNEWVRGDISTVELPAEWTVTDNLTPASSSEGSMA
jgi:hypothetical protein